MNNRSKKHHFVPAGYLAGFCDAEGRLHECMLRSSDGKTIRPAITHNKTPKSVAYEKNLNTVPQECDPLEVERKLASAVDDPGATAIREVLRVTPAIIDPVRYQAVIEFIAYQATRVPAALEFKSGLTPYVKAGIVADRVPTALGPTGISEDADCILREMRGWTWHLKCFDGRLGTILVTSDRPVGLYGLAEWDGRRWLQPAPLVSSDPGCWRKEAICTFPLSSQHVVLGFKGPKRRLSEVLTHQLHLVSHSSVAAWINAMTAHNANHIYWCGIPVQYLLPNKPGETAATMKNSTGSIEEFVSAVGAFDRANSQPLPPLPVTARTSECK